MTITHAVSFTDEDELFPLPTPAPPDGEGIVDDMVLLAEDMPLPEDIMLWDDVAPPDDNMLDVGMTTDDALLPNDDAAPESVLA